MASGAAWRDLVRIAGQRLRGSFFAISVFRHRGLARDFREHRPGGEGVLLGPVRRRDRLPGADPAARHYWRARCGARIRGAFRVGVGRVVRSRENSARPGLRRCSGAGACGPGHLQQAVARSGLADRQGRRITRRALRPVEQLFAHRGQGRSGRRTDRRHRRRCNHRHFAIRYRPSDSGRTRPAIGRRAGVCVLYPPGRQDAHSRRRRRLGCGARAGFGQPGRDRCGDQSDHRHDDHAPQLRSAEPRHLPAARCAYRGRGWTQLCAALQRKVPGVAGHIGRHLGLHGSGRVRAFGKQPLHYGRLPRLPESPDSGWRSGLYTLGLPAAAGIAAAGVAGARGAFPAGGKRSLASCRRHPRAVAPSVPLGRDRHRAHFAQTVYSRGPRESAPGRDRQPQDHLRAGHAWFHRV